jgi:hypothetical protein
MFIKPQRYVGTLGGHGEIISLTNLAHLVKKKNEGNFVHIPNDLFYPFFPPLPKIPISRGVKNDARRDLPPFIPLPS